MKLLRLDSDRGLNQHCETITIEHNGTKISISPRADEIEIHCHNDKIFINPLCGNQIAVKGE